MYFSGFHAQASPKGGRLVNEVSQTASTNNKAVSFVFQVSSQPQPLAMVTLQQKAKGTPFPSLDDKQSFENRSILSGQKSQNCFFFLYSLKFPANQDGT